MGRYYSVTLLNKKTNSLVSYWADCFSVDKNGVLRVQSRECGDITVRIKPEEHLSVYTADVKDEFEEMIDCEKGGELYGKV